MLLAVADLSIAHETSGVAPVLTASAGGATLEPGGTETASGLFDAADAELYRAKQAGRNRVAWREAGHGGAHYAALRHPL
jgi:PleD family two-component response regulator